jgi:Tfp pilus assembly protein PilN
MNTVKKEQAELEKKLADINYRIDAIQKLRASQQGPSAVLAEIKARFDGVPGLYLKSVEQKDAELTIKGESPNEASVTRFGQSMEFSSGLFTNLNIETTRQLAQLQKSPTGTQAQAQPVAANGILAVLPEVVTFTIKCNYGPLKPPETANPTPAASTTANQVAARN